MKTIYKIICIIILLIIVYLLYIYLNKNDTFEDITVNNSKTLIVFDNDTNNNIQINVNTNNTIKYKNNDYEIIGINNEPNSIEKERKYTSNYKCDFITESLFLLYTFNTYYEEDEDYYGDIFHQIYDMDLNFQDNIVNDLLNKIEYYYYDNTIILNNDELLFYNIINYIYENSNQEDIVYYIMEFYLTLYFLRSYIHKSINSKLVFSRNSNLDFSIDSGWCDMNNNRNNKPYIEIQLNDETIINGIITQSYFSLTTDLSILVSEYKVLTSNDGFEWNFIKNNDDQIKIFNVKYNIEDTQDTIKYFLNDIKLYKCNYTNINNIYCLLFDTPVKCKYIRVYPINYYVSNMIINSMNNNSTQPLSTQPHHNQESIYRYFIYSSDIENYIYCDDYVYYAQLAENSAEVFGGSAENSEQVFGASAENSEQVFDGSAENSEQVFDGSYDFLEKIKNIVSSCIGMNLGLLKSEYIPTTTQPSTTQPSTTQPLTTQPLTTQPSTTQPSTTLPSTTQPSTTQPSTTLPSTTQPSTTQPSTTQPSTTQPSTTQPSTTLPSTTQPSTTQPSTTQPSTTQPSTTLPSTTQPSTTQPSTTQPSTTQPSTTQPSTTQPSTTQPSTTQPSTTQPSSTQSIQYQRQPKSQSQTQQLEYNDFNIGMMLKGNYNQDNLNNFLSKNTMLGNNFYISPNSISSDGFDINDDFFEESNNKIIYSSFNPIIDLQ
jgi:hypothetical protein